MFHVRGGEIDNEDSGPVTDTLASTHEGEQVSSV